MISIIVAAARDGAIGRGGALPFRIPTDMRHFKAVTMGKPVVMGRRTWESLPGGALPGRRNIVVTRRTGYRAEGAETAPSVKAALALAGDAPEVMIIGGGEIYAQTLPMADRVYLTRVDVRVPDADTFFPELDPAEWTSEPMAGPVVDERSGLRVEFVCLSRK